MENQKASKDGDIYFLVQKFKKHQLSNLITYLEEQKKIDLWTF